MERRTSKLIALLALGLFPLLTACAATDDTPETHLSWGVNDRVKRAPVKCMARPWCAG